MALPCLVLLVSPTLALAQWEPTARLGLSAAPDHYLDTIAPDVGEPFTLHVILTGMSADEPLAFELQSVEWVIHTICCGDSPVGVTSLVHAPGFEVDGDPYEAIASLKAFVEYYAGLHDYNFDPTAAVPLAELYEEIVSWITPGGVLPRRHGPGR